MIYTLQTHTTSGSWAAPDGKSSLHWVRSKKDAAGVLLDWAEEQARYDGTEQDATALVWIGRHIDVTDLYPDFELTLGPRLGVHWNLC